MLMAYRSTEHEYTPARLMLGWEIRFPVDLATARPSDEELPTVTLEYAVDLQAWETMKRQYDRSLKEQGFVEGACFVLQSSTTQGSISEAADSVGGPIYDSGACIERHLPYSSRLS